MANTYWKTLGKSITKKFGSKALSAGGKTIGRVAVVAGAALSTYEFLNAFKKNMKNEPAFQEMTKYKLELEKWSSAISCIGREPYIPGKLGSVNEGGCINALLKKKTLNLGGYQSSKSNDIIEPDPKLAKDLLERAVDYIAQTENLVGDGHFEEPKKGLIKTLSILNEQIENPYKSGIDYSLIQQELSEIIKDIIPIESAYKTKIHYCLTKLEATKLRNAAWAAGSTLTMGIIKKKKTDYF